MSLEVTKKKKIIIIIIISTIFQVLALEHNDNVDGGNEIFYSSDLFNYFCSVLIIYSYLKRVLSIIVIARPEVSREIDLRSVQCNRPVCPRTVCEKSKMRYE